VNDESSSNEVKNKKIYEQGGEKIKKKTTHSKEI
jgi:hypothetical protein